MKTYYDTNLNLPCTEMALQMKGYPSDETILASIGVYPITNIFPVYDKDTQDIEPEEIVVNHENHTAIQNFKIVDCNPIILQANLERVKNEKHKEALTKADESVSAYLSQYSDIEQLTFPQQQKEVEAYLLDSTSSTPSLDEIAENRGVPRLELIQKAISKVQLFTAMSAKIVGQQQKYEDMITSIINSSTLTLVEKIQQIREINIVYQVA